MDYQNQKNQNSDNNKPEGFSCRYTKDGKLFMYKNSKVVKTLKGFKAAEIWESIKSSEKEEAQMILAIETGQFKFGNEKLAKNKNR